MQHVEGQFAAHDGLSLFRQSWLPAAAPRAVVAAHHGIFEHSGRYAALAAALVARDYAVAAFDYRGHGRSAGERAMIWSFDHLSADQAAFLALLDEEYAATPRFLFGHSLGALLCLRWALGRDGGCRGLALSGPPLQLQQRVFPVLRRLAPWVSRFAPRLRFARLGSSRISRDPAVVQAFRADPLVFHDRFPVRTGAEVLRTIEEVSGRLEEVRLPLLALHGTADAMADSRGSRRLVRRAASPDKTLRLYEGLYHEVLNEPERAAVLTDLLDWLDERAEIH